jgi:hypothetical protein
LKLLKQIENNRPFSELSVRALQKIKRFALAISVIYAAGMPFLLSMAEQDDAPGLAALGVIFLLTSLAVAAAAAVLETIARNENENKSGKHPALSGRAV